MAREEKGAMPRGAGGLAILMLTLAAVAAAGCGGGGGGAAHIAVADDRGYVHVIDVGDTELSGGKRIGRLADIDLGGMGSAIHVVKDGRSGAPEYVAASALVLTKSGDRLTAYSDRRTATTIERGPADAEIGDGDEIVTGELAVVLYHLDDDVLFFSEESGNVVACYVSESGKEPERIAIGSSCRVDFAAGLVEVHTARNVAFYDYGGREVLEMNTARFSDVQARVLSGGDALAATLRSESGLTELIYGRFSGDQEFVTAGDSVRILAASPQGDWFAYSKSDAGSQSDVYLRGGRGEVFVGRGAVELASMSPDGKSFAVALVDGIGRVEVWVADLEADPVHKELVFDEFAEDLAGLDVEWAAGQPGAFLFEADFYEAGRNIAELRTPDGAIDLIPSTAGMGGQRLVPVGDGWLWLSEQHPGGGSTYTAAELISGQEVADSKDIAGRILGLVAVDQTTIAVIVDQLGAEFLTLVAADGDELDIADLAASDSVAALYGIGGRVYAETGRSFKEVVTARPGDDDVEALDHDITQIVALLSPDISRHSQSP